MNPTDNSDDSKKYKILIISSNGRCKSNIQKCEQVRRYCERNNHTLVDTLEEADFIVVDTCGVTTYYESRSLNLIQEILHVKTVEIPVISVGCINRINPEAVREISENVHIVEDLTRLDQWIKRSYAFDNSKDLFIDQTGVERYVNTADNDAPFKKIVLGFGETLEKISASLHYPFIEDSKLSFIIDELGQRNKVYVEIGRGCIHKCTYCVIKKVKGNPASRKISEILTDLEQFAASNCSVELVCDDCGSFGVDTGESFIDLLSQINVKYPQIKLDIPYLHPNWITVNPEAYLSLFERVNINSVNIPIQSGSNKIIRKMNRRYQIEDVLKFVKNLRATKPKVFIWTHYIVGFPSETWQDYRASVSSARYFDFYYVFPFSSRKGMSHHKPSWLRTAQCNLLHVFEGACLVKKLFF